MSAVPSPFSVIFVGCILICLVMVISDVITRQSGKLGVDLALMAVNSLGFKKELTAMRARSDSELGFDEEGRPSRLQ